MCFWRRPLSLNLPAPTFDFNRIVTKARRRKTKNAATSEKRRNGAGVVLHDVGKVSRAFLRFLAVVSDFGLGHPDSPYSQPPVAVDPGGRRGWTYPSSQIAGPRDEFLMSLTGAPRQILAQHDRKP